TLRGAGIVSGRVLTPDGAPIAGARVGRVLEAEQRLMGGVEIDIPEIGEIETLRGGEAVVTDEHGQFELAHVAPGELTLRARHPEHPTAKSQPIAVEAGREVPSMLLTMQVGGVIAGVVEGLPAETKGLQVMAARKPKAEVDPSGMGAIGSMLDDMTSEAGIAFPERTAAIGADGRFELRGLARDTYLVWVGRTGGSFAGGTVCSARVEASPGGSVQLVFDPGVTVTFTVADAKSGAPIERMTVRDRLRGGGMNDLMSGVAAMGAMQSRRPASYPNGAVTVANLRPKANQKLTLTVEALGYAVLERRDVELPKAGNLDLGVLELDQVPVLHVTVVASHDGQPVQGASVRMGVSGNSAAMRDIPREFRRFVPGNASGLQSGRTDRDGRITLNRPQQAATIEVDAKGFAPFANTLDSTASPDAYTAQLQVGGGVAVTVCDLAEKPVAGASVDHRSPGGEVDRKKTDGLGVAHFEHLTPGAHQFCLGKESGDLGRMMRWGGRRGADPGATAAPAQDAQPWQPVEVADEATATLRLTKQPTATLRGIVRENGLALAGARVVFREGPATGGGEPGNVFGDMVEQFAGGAAGGVQNRSPRTDEQGLYQMRELPEGAHHLRITHKSRTMPATVSIVLRNGENVFDVDLDMTMLRGVVKDSDGKPVDGARIRVRRPRTAGDPANEIGDAMESMAAGMNMPGGLGGTAIKTDATGSFELRGIDPDVELELQASAKGFAPIVAKVTAARGVATAVSDLVLGASGKVRVSVAGNQQFGAVRARWVGNGDDVAPVLGALRRGKGTLEGLRPGTWEVALESMASLGALLGNAPGGQQSQPQQKRTVEVIAGQTVDIDM
ncbi:MAG TPA: carboxypeptidase-like regulatory domain-containing protein, partial [Planctomycetota bacterium]|nr:carboxypeptidase-like regulatory domain-containing protein [Planctomycetota bacterium]